MADKNNSNWVKNMALGSTIATANVGLVVGGYFLGNFLDFQLGTDPWLKLILMVAGVLLGIGYLILFFAKLGKIDDKP